MSIEEIKTLQREAGAAQFIAQHTGLSYERVLRIYRLGNPWPLGRSEAWDLSRQAAETGTDVFSCMAALAPLVEMTADEKRAKLEAFEEKLGEGIHPSTEEAAELKAEFANPILDGHLEKVSNLTGEPIDVIMQVFKGVLAILAQMGNLVQELIDQRLLEERNSNR